MPTSWEFNIALACGKFKFCCLELCGIMFFKYFWFSVGWIHRWRTHRYEVLTVCPHTEPIPCHTCSRYTHTHIKAHLDTPNTLGETAHTPELQKKSLRFREAQRLFQGHSMAEWKNPSLPLLQLKLWGRGRSSEVGHEHCEQVAILTSPSAQHMTQRT